MKNRLFPRALEAIVVASLAVSAGRAQTASQEPPPADILMNPFVVQTDTETGYAATNTLDGSRLNTALKDTPSPISVFTRDLLDDINATDLSSMMRYDLSNEVEMSDANSAGTGSEVGSIARGTTWRTRGLLGGASVNGFVNPGASEVDLYNVERAGSSRGPNAILFGTGAPGGVVNLSTKSAQPAKSATILEFKVGGDSTRRTMIDVNHVLKKDKLALRVIGLYDEKGSYLPHIYSRKSGVTLAGQYRFGKETALKVSYERLNAEGVGGRPWGPQDSITTFLNALGSGAVRFDPVDERYETANGAVVGASSGVGTLATRSILVYDPSTLTPVLWEGASVTANRNTLSSTTSQYAGAKPSVPASISPYGQVNATGAGEYGDSRTQTLNVSFTHRLFRNFYMELTYNRAQVRPNGMIGGNPELRADLNYRLPNGSLNPYFFGNGYYFMQQSWVRVRRINTDETLRAAFSYETDLKKLGYHRFAILAERHNSHSIRYREREAWDGTPFGGAPEGTPNHVTRRKYFKIDGPYADWGLAYNPVRFGSESFTSSFATIGTLRSTWVPANALDIDDDVDTDSLVAVMQNFFFNRRLVTTLGLRQDRIDIFGPRTLRDAVTNRHRFATEADQPSFDAAGLQWYDAVKISGDRVSLGGVFHLNEHFSLTANTSDGVQLPERNRSVLPIERPADPYPGESRDAGINFSFLNNRIAGSVRVYESVMRKEPSNGGVTTTFVNPNNDVMSSFEYYYRQAGLTNLGANAPISSIDDFRAVYFSEADAYLSDAESKGFEFEVIANVTRNWSIRAGYANTRNSRTNVLTEGEGWWAERLELWEQLDAYYMAQTGRPSIYNQLMIDRNNAVTDRSVIDRIGDSATELAAIRAEEQHGFGVRRHKVNLWTRYTFSSGPLKGLAVGGGHIYQSGNLAGYDVATGRSFYGESRSIFDLFLQYRTKGFLGMSKDRLLVTYQLNVNNLFDSDTVLSTKLLVDSVTGELYNRRAYLETPRTATFTLRFNF